MAIVYQHLKPNGQVFYVGIGKEKSRAYSKCNRSKYWKNYIKNCEYEVQILKSDLNWNDACELEKILISHYGRKDLGTGFLINMTNGGDGTYGLIMSEESNIKRKLAMSGRTFTKEHVQKLRNKKLGTIQTKEQKINRGIYKSKQIINTKTNEIYNSVLELSIILNVKVKTLQKKLNGQLKNNTNFKYTGIWL
jgi:hypothetical protein